MDAPMIQIGASNKEAVEAARDAILAILGTPRGDKVVGEALQAFTTVCEVKHVAITGCTFYARRPPEPTTIDVSGATFDGTAAAAEP